MIVDAVVVGQQRHRRHNLARLAIPALGNLMIEPGTLDLLRQRLLADGLNGGDLAARDIAHRHDTGTDRLAIHMDRTGATLGNPAAELGTRQFENVPQHPEQWHVTGHIHNMGLIVYFHRLHGALLSPLNLKDIKPID